MRKVLIALFVVVTIMFVEYMYIIYNIKPYIGDVNSEGGGEVYIELFGRIDSYYAEPIDK